MVTAPGVVGREAVVADGTRDARQEPAHVALVERVEDIDMHRLPRGQRTGPEAPDKSPRTRRSWAASRTLICTVSPGASAATAWTMTGSTVSNLPGQVSRLWGQDSQVPAWGDHSAGMRYPRLAGVAEGSEGFKRPGGDRCDCGPSTRPLRHRCVTRCTTPTARVAPAAIPPAPRPTWSRGVRGSPGSRH